MKRLLFAMLFWVLGLYAFGQAPFYCTTEAYLFQYNDVYTVNLATGQAVLEAQDVTPGNINAAAYNPVDGYIWGALTSPEQAIVRIGLNYTTDIYTLPSLFTSNPYVGAINSEGQYYLKPGGQDFQIVDLDPTSGDYLSVVDTKALSQNIAIADWAFNAVDNQLYTVTLGGANKLCRIDPTTGVVEDLGEVPILSGLNYTYGAVYFDVDGNFYVSANQTGTIYVITEVQDLIAGGNINSNLFAYGPASGSNDGARCPTAPVPQEDCDNGLDDDGDGLVDCDDPSCSGVSSCPTITISSANNGGLESGNRLSEHIANRNYTRSLNPQPETFGPELSAHSAKKITAHTKQNFTLRDLIPIGLLGESSALESSPEDLKDITNATEVYSVDFEIGDNKAATVLALETQDGVYEHSKFICDRLLGAELNSVSHIFLKDQPFTKSIIYREDGKREFVLSFSVRMTDAGCIIESHWNLDKYPTDTRYYNFQIWTANIDDLITLSSGILELVEAYMPIESYTLSDPPLVFVQKARLNGDQLELLVMNNNFSTSLSIEGGLRRTETEDFETITKEVAIAPYKNELIIDMQGFFDAGIRLSTERTGTPDDLFVSDGPWGLDASAATTTVQNYEVTRTQMDKTEQVYPVSRGINVEATSTNYIAAYRALTPRFQAVDMRDYSKFSFTASGTGMMEVTLMTAGASGWENQLHSKVLLGDTQKYTLSKNDFVNFDGESSTWEDINMIVFTKRSESGALESLTITVTDLSFEKGQTTSLNKEIDLDSYTVTPNPASDLITIDRVGQSCPASSVSIINTAGVTIRVVKLEGQSEIIDVADLIEGTYMLQYNCDQQVTTQKLVILRR